MHQPWASLLVAGIKRIEGRSWGADNCGSNDFPGHGHLWIHAAAREPDPEDVQAVEEQYRSLYSLDGVASALTFPASYPTSALLGCVDVAAVLPATSYRQAPGLSESERLESESDFVFLCQSPRRLLLPRAMAGQHKIWRLPGAKKAAAGLTAAAPPPPLATDFRRLFLAGR